jgi:hypothetical protein
MYTKAAPSWDSKLALGTPVFPILLFRIDSNPNQIIYKERLCRNKSVSTNVDLVSAMV